MLKAKIIRNFIFSIAMWLISYSYNYAVPAFPYLMVITQPNGDKFKAYQRGDEYFSWWETEKGVVLSRNLDSGYFEYAKISMIKGEQELVPTGIIFVSGEVTSNSIPSISKLNKLNLGKIWKQKREQARKRLQGILEKQK